MNKILVFSFLILPFLIRANNKEVEAIEAFVNNWNVLHNTKDINGFRELYAPTLYFYGKYNEKEDLLVKIAKYIAKDNSQEIITPITISYYTSGNIKCEFTKRIYRSGKVKEYPSYLVIKQSGDKYLITGESDEITDTNLHATMQLGDLLGGGKNNSLMYILITGGVLCIAMYFKKRVRKNRGIQTTVENNVRKKNKVWIPTIPNYQNISIEEQKGKEFENYVAERFNPTYFKIKEWRGDKYHNGIYAESTLYPDLEILYQAKYDKIKFAVECKWRNGFNNGAVKFSKEAQLERYKNYSFEKEIPVFIVLGVGGAASNPDSVYIIPLKDIFDVEYTKDQLKKYYRYKSGDFFLNTYNMELQ